MKTNWNVISNIEVPLKYSDIVVNKKDELHTILYNDAIDKFKYTIKDPKNNSYLCNCIYSYCLDDNSYEYINLPFKKDKSIIDDKIYNFSYINDCSYLWRFIEYIPNDSEYFEPSYVVIQSRTKPFRYLKTLNGSKYHWLNSCWNNEYIIEKQYEITDSKNILNSIESDIENYEIIYIDYINGKYKLYDKISGKTKWIKFEEIDFDTTQINDSILKYTFK